MWSFCFHCPYEIFLDLPPTEQRKSIAAQVRTPLPTHLYSLLDIFLHFCYILVYILVYLFVCVACAWIHKCDSMLTEIRWQPAGVDATMWVLGIQLSCSRLVASALVYWVSTLASTSLFCLLFYLFYISSSHSWPCIPDPSALPPEWGNYGYAPPRLLFPDIFYLVSPAVSVLSLHMALLTTEQLVALLCPTKIKLLFLEMLCKAPLMQQILSDFSSEMLEAR